MEMLNYSKVLPIKYTFDIIVVGGGAAGVAAAVAAAGQGGTVLLIEAEGALGGMSTLGLVPCFMKFGDGIRQLSSGIGTKVFQRLKGSGCDAAGDMSIQAEKLKRIYEEMIEEAGVTLLFYTKMTDVILEAGKITALVLSGKSGMFACQAQVYIDATGDGDLAFLAGAPFQKESMMPGTLCSVWSDIEWSRVKEEFQGKDLEKAYRDGIFTTYDRLLPGIFKTGITTGGGNVGHAFGLDGTDEESITRALVTQRKILCEYEEYYRKYVIGFEKASIISTASLMGVRQTRQIMGDYILSLEDFMNRAVFQDEIGRYCYQIDIHPTTPSEQDYHIFKERIEEKLTYQRGESYGIPYRCLVPKNVDNLLAAGRCISCDSIIQGSIRVIPGCFITGQAAGIAAGVAFQSGKQPRNLDVKEVQRRLLGIGACLPNYEEKEHGG